MKPAKKQIPEKSSVKVVAFDCDGVLFDSQEANTAFYNDILNHLKQPDMTPDQISYVHMHTTNEAIEHLFPDENNLRAALEYRKTMSYAPFMKYMIIEPHLKTLLKKLRPQYHTAIATNRTDTIQTVLQNHDLCDDFDLVVSAMDVEKPKPHPDQLYKILNHFNIQTDEIIYVGDSSVDEEAARAAGISLIAYRNQELAADYHIHSLQEIEGILNI